MFLLGSVRLLAMVSVISVTGNNGISVLHVVQDKSNQDQICGEYAKSEMATFMTSRKFYLFGFSLLRVLIYSFFTISGFIRT